jgi:hypothetical protein
MSVVPNQGPPTATIGNITVPIYSFTVETGAYGMIGRASFTTSIRALKDIQGAPPSSNPLASQGGVTTGGFNIISVLNQGETLTSYTPVQIFINGILIFGGYYYFGHYTFHEDICQIHARDYAAPLFDAKRSLAAYNYQSATVTSLITQIGTQFKIGSFDLRPASNPNVGTIINTQLAGAVDATRPQQLWNYFVLLAKASGSAIYVDPYNVLHLIALAQTIPQGVSQGTSSSPSNSDNQFPARTYYWQPIPGNAQQPASIGQISGVVAQQQGQQVPLLKLEVLHQPQRNKNFAVVFLTHHQGTTQTPVYQIVVMNESIDVPGGGSVAARQYTGTAAASVRTLMSSRGLGIPVYYVFVDGQTPDQIAQLAQSAAAEIASRLYVYTGVVDGDPLLQPLSTVYVLDLPGTPSGATNAVNGLTGPDPSPLIGFGVGFQLTCQSVIHNYNMPQGGEMGSDADGYHTTFKATNLPPLAATPDEAASAIAQDTGD